MTLANDRRSDRLELAPEKPPAADRQNRLLAFTITLEGTRPDQNELLAVRAILKIAWRAYGMRCTHLKEEH